MDIATKISSIPIHTASTRKLSAAHHPNEIRASQRIACFFCLKPK